MKIKHLITLAILPFTLISCGNNDISDIWSEIGFEPLNATINEPNQENYDFSKIRNIIVMIGDGMGYNHVEAGSYFKGSPLCFADESNPDWTYHALVCTDSLTSQGFTLDTTKSLINPIENPTLYDDTPSPYGKDQATSITPYTDSAAAGTALATGKKTTNSRLGMGILGESYDNLVEIAHDLGKKTCVISSDELVGATPSAYLSHISERNQRDQIIKAHATSKADLIITKKPSEWKDNAATSYTNLYKNNNWDNICYSLSDLSMDKNKQICLPDTISATKDRNLPTLKESTIFALDYLDNEEEGFFMMVEGACIDKRAHSNLADEEMIELMAFEETVYETYLWAKGRDDTLIIVTADHETGGLYFDGTPTKSTVLQKMKYLSYNHSRSRVRMDVFGDISAFTSKYATYLSDTLYGRPYWDNTYIFNLCAAYL